jgi:tRNASer (uridine44-2'-O)-methyltransferase
LGYVVEKEMLRIPSTRNAAIVGREEQMDGENGDVDRKGDEDGKGAEQRWNRVKQIVQREVGDLEKVSREWMERAKVIAGSKGAGSIH